MKKILEVTIPFVAPSLNSWYSGQSWHHRSKAKNIWRDYFQLIAKELKPVKASDYPVTVEAVSYFKIGRRRDCSNWTTAVKLAEDALVEIGVLEDDSTKYVSKVIASIHPENHHCDETVIIIYADEFKLT